MQRVCGFATLVMLAAGVLVSAQDVQPANWPPRRWCPPVCPDPTPVAPSHPLTDPPKAPQPGDPSLAESLAQAGEGGTMPAAAFLPGMFGDLAGYSTTRIILIPQIDSAPTQLLVRVPVGGSAGGFKISDHESPRPTDRVYYAYNFYDGVNRDLQPYIPFFVHRHTMAFEKTFLGGDASIGLRVPFVNITGLAPFEHNGVSDLSIVLKYAAINNPQTGNVVSEIGRAHV